MRAMDEIYTECPFYGSRRIKAVLNRQGYSIGRDKVRRLMRVMGIEAIYCKPKRWAHHPDHKIYPYLLRNVPMVRQNQVWSTDITYVPIQTGTAYLVAIMDWFSRFVLAWRLSISMDVDFCIEALLEALTMNKPEIFNSDQGSQFTSNVFTKILLDNEIKISMDGRGRAFDNIFNERLWRSVKYENIYLMDYETVKEARYGLRDYFDLYNYRRPHQALNYATPAEVYFQ
jgi:putative transposase